MHQVLHRVAIAALIAFALTQTAALGAESQVHICGSDDMVWAFRSLPAVEPNAPTLRVVYSPPNLSSLRLRRLPRFSSSGKVKRWAARGQNLHIFFEDGLHYRLRPPPADDLTGRNDFPELNLPESFVPLAVCGDDPAGSICAIVPARIAAELKTSAEPGEPSAATQPATAEETVPPTTQPVVEAAEPTGFTLVRYVRGTWETVSAIPRFFDEQAACLITAYNEKYHIFYTTADGADALMHTALFGQTWTDPRAVPKVGFNNVLCALSHQDTTALVVLEPAETKDYFRVRAITLVDGKWTPQDQLENANGALTVRRDEISVGRYQDQLAVALLDPPEPEEQTAVRGVRVGIWKLAGGQAETGSEEMPALSSASTTGTGQQTFTMLATVVLGALLVLVFVRRRESFLVDLPLPPGFVLATFGRRFMAFAIDLFIVGLIAYPSTFAPWVDAHVEAGEPLWNQVNYAVEHDSAGLYWRWLAAVGLFVLYGVLFESTFAATPGKLMLHLRVCNDRAQRCGVGPALLRNVLRYEIFPLLQFLPTAILVVLTRNRQRFGDLVARTVVVERVATGASIGMPPKHHDEEDSS